MPEFSTSTTHPLDDLQVGDLVKHPKWGVGSILFRSGRGDQTKLVVNFPDLEANSQKKLKASFANLVKIEDSRKRQEDEEERQRSLAVAAAEAAAAKPLAEVEAEEPELDDEDEEVFDEEEAAHALNIEDDEEEVAKADVTDDDWEETDDK